MTQCSQCSNRRVEGFRRCKGCLDRRAQARTNAREFILAYLKEHACVDCGETDPVVLEFDHVRGTKHKDISRLVSQGASVAALEREIAKCEVRCSNDHKRRHRQQERTNASVAEMD